MSSTESHLRQVVIAPGEDGYFVAEVPSLPGCISQGRTRAEAIANIREAITLFIEALEAQGTPVPEDTLERQLVVV
ncbi:type II toxin-antitoxin system HicB family antitoxin [Chloroflexales bacterium ZM16-3]|nr:type II toxin-antitoxin system HicB family antitoxin [Chloroflexales bacterium ZM16-3]